MKPLRILFIGILAVGMTHVGKAQDSAPAAARMTVAAEAFLASLDGNLKKKAMYGFDDPERLGWFFTPRQEKKESLRKGVRLAEMSEKQKEAALALLKTGTSEGGYKQATTIMSLEGLLKELEKGGANVRDPQWYFVSIFGEPSKTGKWGWRFEGHHLSVNFTIENGKVKSPTPFVLATNPAEVKSGDKKGLRALPEVEDQARALLASFDAGQRMTSLSGHFAEVLENSKAPKATPPVGVVGAKMTEGQKAKLKELVLVYLNRMPKDVSEAEWKEIEKAGGLDKIYFAHSGTMEAGTPYTYRIQGPTFVIEMVNLQADSAKNPANHIHSSYRHLSGDFGLGE